MKRVGKAEKKGENLQKSAEGTVSSNKKAKRGTNWQKLAKN